MKAFVVFKMQAAILVGKSLILSVEPERAQLRVAIYSFNTMNPSFQDSVKQYLNMLASLAEARQERFSAAERREVALEAGMTAMDYEQLQEDIAHYVERAHSYRELQRWGEALTEANTAFELDPLNPDTCYIRALIYAQQWKESHEIGHKIAAMDIIARCQRLQPEHGPTAELLAQIALWERQQRRFSVFKSLGAFSILLLMLGTLWVGQQKHWWMPEQAQALPPITYQVPAYVEVPSHLLGVRMQVGQVEVKHVGQNSQQMRISYRYSGNIISDSLEIGRLACQVIFKDSGGAILAMESFQLLQEEQEGDSLDHRYTLHPGDMQSFSRDNTWGLPIKDYEGRQITSVHFRLQDVRARLPEARGFPSYERRRLLWRGSRPYYLQFRAYARVDSLYLNPYDSLVTHYSHIALHNLGRKPCKELRLMLTWRDGKGDILQERELQVIDTSMLILPAQDIVMIRWKEHFRVPKHSFPVPFKQFEVSVAHAR